MSRLIFPASPRGDALAASQAKYESGGLGIRAALRVDAIRALGIGATGTIVQFPGLSNLRFQVGRVDASDIQFRVTDTNNGTDSQLQIPTASLPGNGNDIRVYMRSGSGAGARQIAIATDAGVGIGTDFATVGGSTATGAGTGAIRLGSDGTTGWGVNLAYVAVTNAAITGAARFATPLAADSDVIGLYEFAEGAGTTAADSDTGTALTLTDTIWDGVGGGGGGADVFSFYLQQLQHTGII
jgi:hypothetical protein